MKNSVIVTMLVAISVVLNTLREDKYSLQHKV